MLKTWLCGSAVLGSILLVACSGNSSDISASNKALLSAKDVKKPTGECREGKFPNVCCQGERCYTWIDDPFRACEFGFTSITDGSRCCGPNAKCSDPKPKPEPICGAGPIAINDCQDGPGYSVSSRPAGPGEPEVHVIGVYETDGGHSFKNHPRGKASVRVERKGHHILVLSSYEPVDYSVTALPGAYVDQIILNGFWDHTVSGPPGAQIIDRSGVPNYLAACAIVYEGDNEGCDTTSLLSGVEKLTGHPVTSFAGCYQASEFVIRNDADDCTGTTPKPTTPPPPPPSSTKWVPSKFQYDRSQSDCAGGAQYARYEPRYAKWVGVELCSATRYKIYLGEQEDGIFHEIGDGAGNGQDHCELVNPSFTLPDEDDITSGGCPTCDVEMAAWERPGAVPVYTRGYLGEPFELRTWPEQNIYTSRWYQCGVSVP